MTIRFYPDLRMPIGQSSVISSSKPVSRAFLTSFFLRYCVMFEIIFFMTSMLNRSLTPLSGRMTTCRSNWLTSSRMPLRPSVAKSSRERKRDSAYCIVSVSFRLSDRNSLANPGNKSVRSTNKAPDARIAATEKSITASVIHPGMSKSSKNTANPVTDVPKANAFHGISA